jgi:hypothetical protein
MTDPFLFWLGVAVILASSLVLVWLAWQMRRQQREER